jgi:hypothetical protein
MFIRDLFISCVSLCVGICKLYYQCNITIRWRSNMNTNRSTVSTIELRQYINQVELGEQVLYRSYQSWFDTSSSKMSTSESSNYTPDIPSAPITKTSETIHIELTPHDLDSLAATRFVRSPSAGATVLFIGTTRDSFNDKVVSSLSYTSYAPLAIATLYKIANGMF